MKKLQKSDLKEGEIYKQLDFNYIFLYNKNETSDNFNDGTAISTTAPRYCKRWTANGFEKDMIEATPEEKHWLETCIKENKFISYEEAMKTFIPEYVKCIKVNNIVSYTLNKIYKITNKLNYPSVLSIVTDQNQYVNVVNWNESFVIQGNNCFKPSTKEAYDAQFVVKEPEFVLPKLWCIKLTNENQKTVIGYINKNTNDGERSGNIGMYYGYNGVHCTCIFKTLSNTEITFDQFQKYVLKEEKETVTIKTTVETKSKFINNNTVETSEGSIFKVGDLVTPFENSSPNKGKKFKITGFRWNNSQTEICAITDLHKPYGIGVEKLEIYLESRVKTEIVDDFILPEKWCVEVNSENENFINSVRDRSCSFTFITSNLILPYVKNSWYCHPDAKKRGFTEITFEQFKKYVLKDE